MQLARRGGGEGRNRDRKEELREGEQGRIGGMRKREDWMDRVFDGLHVHLPIR